MSEMISVGDRSAPAMPELQKTSGVPNKLIQEMRGILGHDFCEKDLVHSLHLARNDVQMAINILMDLPGFRNRSPGRNQNAAAARNSAPKAGSRPKAVVAASSTVAETSVRVKAEAAENSSEAPVKASTGSPVQLVGSALSGLSLNRRAESVCSTPPPATADELDAEATVRQVKSEPQLHRKRDATELSLKSCKGEGLANSAPTFPEERVISTPSSLEDEKRLPRITELNEVHDCWPDPPDETKWWLLEEAEVVSYSTSRGSKIHSGDSVTFNFPKPAETKVTESKKNWNRARSSSEIVRFCTKASGEVGRLPADWAKCCIPLVHSGKITIRGRCKSAPDVQTLMSSILLETRIYINQSFFSKYKGTVSLEESTFRPFPSLMQLLGKNPVKKAEFTPEDLNVYTRKGVRAEEAAAGKRVKRDSNDDEDAVMGDCEVNHVVGTSDSRELQEMDEPEGLECKLRPYQKQALFWMSKLETCLTQEDAAKTLHPCWSEYHLADRRASAFYVNAFSGEATLDFPSAMQTTRGGILADAMGLGKTVMTISLLLSNRGKGSPGLRNDDVKLPFDKSRRVQSQMKEGRTKSPSRMRGGGTLIVCPMTLLSQWQSELQTHVSSGTFSVYAYYGSERVRDARDLSKHDVVLTTYGVIQSEDSNNGGDGPVHSVHWFRIVLDEAHSIKASKSASAQAIFKLVGDRRLCLTGTPVQNKLEDLYSLFYFLRAEPWCNWGWWHKLIQKPYEEGDERGLKLLQVVLKPLMLRRTKDSTDKEGRPILVLPPAESEIVHCELSEAERDFYDALYHKSKVKFDQFVEQGKVLHNYASILELLLRLRQTCDHPFLVMSRGDTEEYADMKKLAKRFMKNDSSDAQCPPTAFVSEVVEDIRKGESFECPICLEVPEDEILTPCAHRMCRECIFNSWRTNGGGLCPICRGSCKKQDLITVPTSSRFRIDVEQHWTESSKVKALMEQLEITRSAGTKSVVFSQWTAFLDLLEIPLKRRKFQYVRLDGTLSQQKREQVLKDFSGDSNISLMLISLKAGGVGLNLTTASNAFLLDPWWNPAVEEQAIMRIHRIGQVKKVSIKRFIVKGTVEERMQQVQARKQRMIAGALTDDEVRSARIEELKMLFR